MRMLADTLQAHSESTKIYYLRGIHPYAMAKTSPVAIGITHSGYKQDPRSLAVTFIHEWVHAVDYELHDRLQFAHYTSTQDRCVNRNTASYRIERVAEKILNNPDFATGCSAKVMPAKVMPAKTGATNAK